MENTETDLKKLFGGVYNGKTVLVTGHTGFKGSWLSIWLSLLGAKVIGYALDPITEQDNFVVCGLQSKMTDLRSDIRDDDLIKRVLHIYQPELVFHLAAQPILRRSYLIPQETFEVNVMGTVNLMEAIRSCPSVKAAVIVTSDKCYENKEDIWGYREDDKLGGFDPYSASKACQELVTSAYRSSYFDQPAKTAVATVRAGNVFGGGDWSPYRLIPDCVRALREHKPVEIRNPESVRPWQFVLEPLYGYLLLGEKLLQEGTRWAGAWNFGPDFGSIVKVGVLAELFAEVWGGERQARLIPPDGLHEPGLLSLDCTKAKALLGWKPRLNLRRSVEYTVQWYRNTEEQVPYFNLCKNQIESYCKLV
ncbi:MAG TPA: CDP-glucose 4,6-dehydratase [Caproiciproducens sp.]|nr:CDP-glucose 4,6-dehydratase [Caproiciproducens sp.]